MDDILLALRRAVTSLANPRMLVFVLLPLLVSGIAWFALAYAYIDVLRDAWLGWEADLRGDGQAMLMVAAAMLLHWMVWPLFILWWVGALGLAYFTALLLLAVLLMPWVVREVARRDYPGLAERGDDAFWPALWNGLAATGLALAGWLFTLPLWLIPGMGIVLSLFWFAFLAKRSFSYDALSIHATREESLDIRRKASGALWGLGLFSGLASYLPLAGLLAPLLAALAYTHFCLERLSRLRAAGQGA